MFHKLTNCFDGTFYFLIIFVANQIYFKSPGWKVLVEDVEFLTGNKLKKCWVLGWCAVPGIMTPFTLWWIITLIKKDPDWTEPPLDASTLLATLGLVLVTFTLLAAVSVARQVQYDFIGVRTCCANRSSFCSAQCEV